MRVGWLFGVATVLGSGVGCLSVDSSPGSYDGAYGGSYDPPTIYTGRFGGSFDAGDNAPNADDGTGSDGSGDDGGSGEEYAIISTPEGDVACDWRWTTDTLASSVMDCEGCDQAWDVTCWGGHATDGNACRQWFEETPPVEFYLAFEPNGTGGDVEHGTVYVRHSLYDKWTPYAPGFREDGVVHYSYEMELY